MKVLLGLTFGLLTLGVQSKADVCFTDYTAVTQQMSYDQFEELLLAPETLYLAKYSCQELDTIADSMEVVGYAIQGVGIGAACTGFGLPVAVTLEVAGIALGVAGMMVNNLDCQDTDQSAEIQRKVDEALCQALRKQGHTCETPITQL